VASAVQESTVGPQDNCIRGSFGDHAEIANHPRIERVPRSRASQRSFELRSQHPIDSPHLDYSRLRTRSDESRTEFAKDATHSSVVNVCVGSVDVAQRFLDAVFLSFTDDPRVLRITNAYSDAKLESMLNLGVRGALRLSCTRDMS
jgi:hypothetical protein